MATVLQRQLAEIAANSTHQLDLKAQKTRHARSLLFHAADASRQSFDSIYQICREGFDELCQLDAQFLAFASNLFAEESKSVDRGQLTQQENDSLNRVIESYLGLIHGRLLLKPAQKSLEWLVRRWKVHEFSPVALLLTFLPYHKNEGLFPAALSLFTDSQGLPEAFKWLHPYVASQSCPPEYAVLSAAINNRSFFTAFNAYTLRAARAGHASGVLLAYWAGLLLKAVNGMLDSSRSGRATVRQQKEEDVLTSVLPILRDSFDISKRLLLDEMYIGACMVTMLLATRAELADITLDALMETVAASWSEKTVFGGVSCLAQLAEAKDDSSLLPVVVSKLLDADPLSSITELARGQKVSSLAAAFGIGLLRSTDAHQVATNMRLVRAILETGVIQPRHCASIVDEFITRIKADDDGILSSSAQGMLALMSNDERYSSLLRWRWQDSVEDTAVLQALTEGQYRLSDAESSDNETEMVDAPEFSTSARQHPKDVSEILKDLPQADYDQYSFLDARTNSRTLLQSYISAFTLTTPSKHDEQMFMDRLQGQPSSQSSVTLISLLARLWSTAAKQVGVHTKVEALDCANQIFRSVLVRADRSTSGEATFPVEVADSQALYPYLLTALTDKHQHVRAAAGRVWMSFGKYIAPALEADGTKSKIWAGETLYGEHTPGTIFQLSPKDSCRLISIIVEVLDDCMLNAGFLTPFLGDLLSSVKSEPDRVSLCKQQRNVIRDFLASHAAVTASMNARLVLLRILGAITKGADSTRVRYLLPLLKEWARTSEQILNDLCASDGVDFHDIDHALLDNMLRSSGDAIRQAREVSLRSNRQSFVEMTFDHQRQVWTNLKSTQAKSEAVQWLLTITLDSLNAQENVADLALQTLKALELPTEIVLAILETIPKTADLQAKPPPSKKQRRASNATHNLHVAHNVAQMAIQKIRLILELVEQSRPDSLKLLQPLFQVLAELWHFKAITASDLTYLHALTLDALLSVVQKVQQAKDTENIADWNFVRIDLLIDCIRNSSSPQVQDTAVLLVSALASWIPDAVLHSVMPLFTFMSTTILQRNDEYSAHITEQAVARIVPALASSLQSRGQNVLIGVSEMLLSFIAAWEHVPLHRRLLTFEMVVDAVGANSCLGAVCAMLAERYAETASVTSFIVELIAQRSAVEIVDAAKQWLELVIEGLETPSPKKSRKVNISDVIFGMSDKDSEERAETLEKLIEGLRDLLRSDEVKKALARSLKTENANDSDAVYRVYSLLLEHSIRLAQSISDRPSIDIESSNQVLSAILDLLPTPDFIASSAGIMQAGSDASRELVFRSLESRVQACRSNNVVESKTFIDILPSCTVFVNADQSLSVIAAAIGCIDAICDKFGKTNPLMVRDAANAVVSKAALGSENTRLRTLSLLCLASIAGVLEDGDESLAVFPRVLDSTLAFLEMSTADAFHGERDASFRVLTALLDHSPWMVVTDSRKLDHALTAGVRVGSNESEVVRDFLGLAARRASAAELLASVERVIDAELRVVENEAKNDVDPGLDRFFELIAVFRQAVAAGTKATITKNATAIFKLLLAAFDLPRRLITLVEDSKAVTVWKLGSMVDEVALDVTLKMNDATFRPFFIQFVDWSTSSLADLDTTNRQERAISLYRFALLLFERLGALVVSYMSYLLESAKSILARPTKNQAGGELVCLVVKTLNASFQADEDDFWIAPAHFDEVEDVLINRLSTAERQITDEGDLLIETISNLAAAVNASPEQLKRINTRLLSILRHQDSDARLAALRCQRAITAKVNFDWLALLPEMLPVISELQEDDDDRVERETLRWVKEIEDVSGESLEGMLA